MKNEYTHIPRILRASVMMALIVLTGYGLSPAENTDLSSAVFFVK